jgi:hypothetical protein
VDGSEEGLADELADGLADGPVDGRIDIAQLIGGMGAQGLDRSQLAG